MEGPRDSDRTREQGIDFGSLAEDLATHEYPATTAELLADYGDAELSCSNGTQTFQSVLEPFAEMQFDSAGEVRQAVYTMVDDAAIGRKYYSDRTPPAPGEDREGPDESF
ncbi:hypothetical protein ACFQPA_17660 [Halomarina halobia]|uniref:DUF2795 domain-containing protein n=1 Tax=Halomarina halobia TaxID=3033386 RepID=A0ABD6AD71_9EURY|nr:hypothetical protein [Halomarina sp. PSR21]